MRTAAAIALLAAFAAPAGAQQAEQALGKRVTTVVVEIEGVRTDDSGLTSLVDVRSGAPLDAREVRESIAHLFSLGRFEDVRVHAVQEAGGVAVRFELLPLHSVRRVDFQGQIGLGEGDLRRAVSERFGLAPSATRAGEVVEFLRGYYRDRGFPDAVVTTRTAVEHAPERATLVFDVMSGPRVTITKVNVEGNAPGSIVPFHVEPPFGLLMMPTAVPATTLLPTSTTRRTPAGGSPRLVRFHVDPPGLRR